MDVPTGLSEAIIAALITATGLFAIVLGALRSASGDRAPFWFGLFGCLYGLRLAGYSQLLQPLLPEILWRYLDAFVTYAIAIPGTLFLESLLGRGWRSSVRRTWQLLSVYALLAMANDLVRRDPGASTGLNLPVVLVVGLVAIFHLVVHRRWTSWPRESRAAVLGGLVFLVAAGFQTVHGGARLEHFALLIFMTTAGYAVIHRMLATERRFVAVARELDIAREIQRSILPRTLPDTNGLRVAACYLPMSEIGGDFYDFDSRQASCLGVILADVSGHGVPAALIASMVKIGFAAEAERLHDPGLVLKNINRMLCGKFAGAYVTACCVYIDSKAQSLRYASAGHPAPLLRRRDGRVEVLGEGGLLLTLAASAEYATAEVTLDDGDRLVIFSDGLVEARNARDELFENDRLEKLLATHAAVAPGQFIEHVIADVRRWVGPRSDLQDDVTIVVIDVGKRA